MRYRKILLFILYKKAILPFSEKMLILTRNEEDIEKPHLNIDDDEGEDLITKVQQMRKKVEDQLGVSDGLNEDELKYEVLLEKIKVLMEDSPEEISALLESLVKEESDSLRGF
jgi:flagellar M-ring protein FliF